MQKKCSKITGVEIKALLKHSNPEKYLPIIHMYRDDIDLTGHSIFCGVEKACQEFNETLKLRKIEKNIFLETTRLFKKAKWIKKMQKIHILDHPIYAQSKEKIPFRKLANPYL